MSSYEVHPLSPIIDNGLLTTYSADTVAVIKIDITVFGLDSDTRRATSLARHVDRESNKKGKEGRLAIIDVIE